jgi:hypothetical protein
VVAGAVVAAVPPLPAQLVGQLDHLGGLERRVSLVRKAKRLVVDVLVGVALRLDERHDPVVAPHRPGVRTEVDLRFVAPPLERLVEVAGEVAGVAGAGAAKRLDVVQRVVGVLRACQRTELRDPDVHLLGRLGVGRVEELEAQPGDVADRAGFGDAVGRRQVRHAWPGSRLDPDAAAHQALRSVVQETAERVGGPACHRVAGDDVLADGVLVEARSRARGDDRHLARADVGLVDDALHAAVVVDVGVGVDHRGDRLVAHVLADQRHALLCGLDACHAVDHHQALGRLDDGQVRDVVVADLENAIGDLEQPADLDHLRLAVEARLDRVRSGRVRIVVDPVEVALVEDGVLVVAADRLLEVGDPAPGRVLEVGDVVHRVLGDRSPVRLDRCFARILRLGRHPRLLATSFAAAAV